MPRPSSTPWARTGRPAAATASARAASARAGGLLRHRLQRRVQLVPERRLARHLRRRLRRRHATPWPAPSPVCAAAGNCGTLICSPFLCTTAALAAPPPATRRHRLRPRLRVQPRPPVRRPSSEVDGDPGTCGLGKAGGTGGATGGLGALLAITLASLRRRPEAPSPHVKRPFPSHSSRSPLAAPLAWGSPARGPTSPGRTRDPASETRRFALWRLRLPRRCGSTGAQLVYVNPISLNTENAGETSWIEHRLRVDGAGRDWRGEDPDRLLDGRALRGASGATTGRSAATAASNAGTHVDAKNPNVATPCVALRDTTNPLSPTAYGYTACPADIFTARAQALRRGHNTFGLLRVGRQPSVQPGLRRAGRRRRRPHRQPVRASPPRATTSIAPLRHRPLEAFEAREAPRHLRQLKGSSSPSRTTGWLVTSDPEDLGAAVNQWDTALRFLMPRHALGSDSCVVTAYHAYRWDALYSTRINAIGLRAMSRAFGDVTPGSTPRSTWGRREEIWPPRTR